MEQTWLDLTVALVDGGHKTHAFRFSEELSLGGAVRIVRFTAAVAQDKNRSQVGL